MKDGSADFTLLTIDGYDLLGAKPQQFAERREALLERVDGLGDKVEAQGPTGLTKITIAQGGAFFDDRQHGMHVAFAHLPTAAQSPTRTLVYSFTGGKTVTTVAGVFAESYAVVAQQAKLTKANVTYHVNGIPSDGGRLVQGTTLQTATWTGAVVDLGASATTGADIVQQVLDLADADLAGVVHASADGVTGWAAVASFATVLHTGTLPSIQTLSIGTTINRYVRYVGTLTASGPNPLTRVAIILTPHS